MMTEGTPLFLSPHLFQVMVANYLRFNSLCIALVTKCSMIKQLSKVWTEHSEVPKKKKKHLLFLLPNLTQISYNTPLQEFSLSFWRALQHVFVWLGRANEPFRVHSLIYCINDLYPSIIKASPLIIHLAQFSPPNFVHKERPLQNYHHQPHRKIYGIKLT